jgi:hypothetical protein
MFVTGYMCAWNASYINPGWQMASSNVGGYSAVSLEMVRGNGAYALRAHNDPTIRIAPAPCARLTSAVGDVMCYKRVDFTPLEQVTFTYGLSPGTCAGLGGTGHRSHVTRTHTPAAPPVPDSRCSLARSCFLTAPSLHLPM